ncbi:ribosomal protein S19 family protein [Candidatus Micrarchaeota archaeon]|nr:ribosomal protein S19 family protein [Candidatus Micrarchaeota archaeon]
MAKITRYKGKTVDELKAMPLEQFIQILPSKVRRTMMRNGVQTKRFLKSFHRRMKKNKPIKTHFREMVIIPEMLGFRFQVYNGKQYIDFTADIAMIGNRLGEFSNPVQMVRHSGPGIGATRGSKSVELK